MLEELLALGHAGAEYDAWLIRINEGDQFGSGFVAVNPNSKIPALMDRSGPKPIRVFESGAILLYLAEKFGAFLPTEPAARAECLSWLFWQMGSAPYLGGGFGHFYAYAPIKIEYAIDRFAMEVKRQLDVLDRRLAESEYLAGDDYTIADMAVWPWYGALAKGLLYERRRVPAGAGLQARAALGRRRSPQRPAVQARPHGQPHLGRAGRASCTSATTPATSTRRRRTSWRRIDRQDAWPHCWPDATAIDSIYASIDSMPTIVLDTNVLVAALLRGGGSARAVLRACLRDQYQPVLGPALLAEYEDVLGRSTCSPTPCCQPRSAVKCSMVF